MNYALVFRPEVRDELREAYSWYESKQQELCDEFLDCVDEMLNRIFQMPEFYQLYIVMCDGQWCDAFPTLCIIRLYRVG